MYVTYTDDELVEIGMIDPLSLDLAYGNDENGFSLVVPISFTIPKGSLIYIDGTEWGGVVRGCKPSTLGEIPTNTVTGSTWHGILAESFVCPDAGQDYYTASGDANSEIGALIARQGLDDLFDVSPEPSGFSIEYQFVRFDNVYSALRKALAGSGAKLRIEKEPGRKPMLSAVQAESFVDDYSSKRFAYSITDGTPVNHLVVLGKGELKDRIVLHLFADSDGNISQTQTLFGIDEIQSVYELSSEEDMSKLVEEGTKKLAEYQNVSSCELKLPDDESFGIGDTVGIVDEESGISIVSDVTKVIVKIDGNGTPAISNEIGEMSVSNTAAGGYEASSAGATYRAGSGISISGGTISAEVTSEDLDGKASKSHSHDWESVTGKPSSFNPAAHSHDWESIGDKPDSFSPSAHDHDGRYYTEQEVDTKLSGKSDASHSHEWADIGSKPASFPPEAHAHGWGEIDGKPDAFPPLDHSHPWDGITGKPDTFEPKDHAHAVATKDADGFMSAADKSIIESLSGGAVTGVKGAAESAYRTGNVNLTAEDVRAFSSSVELVGDMSLANLLSLPAGAYLVSSDAVGSPCPGSYGNMILSHAMPDGWTGRVNAIVAFDNGAVRVAIGGDWDSGFSWRAVDDYLPSMNGILPISMGGTEAGSAAQGLANLGGLPLAGGTLSSPYAQISREGRSMSWYNGRDGAIVRQTSYTGYNPILSVKSPAGSWEIGTYTNDSLFFNLIADGNYANAVNSPYMQVEMRNNGTLFVNGRSAFTATTLYANGTGTNGTVYLGAAASVYTCFRIIYRDNDWVYGSVDVIWPDGKIVDLPITTKTTYDFWFKVKTMTISGTTITNRTQGCISPNLSTGHWSTQDSGANNIYVVAVIGYVF